MFSKTKIVKSPIREFSEALEGTPFLLKYCFASSSLNGGYRLQYKEMIYSNSINFQTKKITLSDEEVATELAAVLNAKGLSWEIILDL